MDEFPPEFLKQIDFPGNKELWKVNVNETIAKFTFYFIVIITSLVGNGLVTIVLLKKKSLRCITNLFILNLAVSDLLVTCTSTWVHAVDDLSRYWVLGPQFCKINVFMQAAALVSSVLTMTAISIERFFGIVTPFVFCTHQKEKSVASIVTIWMVAATVGIPPAIYTKLHVRNWRDFDEKWCAPTWPTDDTDSLSGITSRGLYYIIDSVLIFAIPLLIMTCAYTAIIIKLRAKKSNLNEVNNNTQKVKNNSRKKVVIMLIILLVVFTICWLPFQISMLYYELVLHKQTRELPEWYGKFTYYARFMTAVNSACNPVIFVCFSQKIRKAIKGLVCNKPMRFRSPGSSRYGSIRSSTRRTWV